MTSTYSLTGTHSQERSYTMDKRGNSNSRDAMYQGVRLCSKFGNFECGREKNLQANRSFGSISDLGSQSAEGLGS